MSKVHYIVRRSRMGRFNFTLISDAGRITGSVVVPTGGRSGADLERDARDKIRLLAATFAGTVHATLDDLDDPSPAPCRQAESRPHGTDA